MVSRRSDMRRDAVGRAAGCDLRTSAAVFAACSVCGQQKSSRLPGLRIPDTRPGRRDTLSDRLSGPPRRPSRASPSAHMPVRSPRDWWAPTAVLLCLLGDEGESDAVGKGFNCRTQSEVVKGFVEGWPRWECVDCAFPECDRAVGGFVGGACLASSC